MLTIICGEDSVASYEYCNQLKTWYQNEQFEVRNIAAGDLAEIEKGLADSVGLFQNHMVFFTQGLNKRLSKRTNADFYQIVTKLAQNKSSDIIDWEDGIGSRELKISKDVRIKEFKLSQSIFKCLDSCYPGNLSSFVLQLNNLPAKIDDLFIMVMLSRHLHALINVAFDNNIAGMPSWQQSKLRALASKWSKTSLLNFYDGLYKLDIAIKSGKNPFTIRESIDTLACYFL